MKALYGILLLIVATATSIFAINNSNNSNTSQNENKVIATFNEVTEDGSYQFTDTDKKKIYFQDIDEDIDLYENINRGKQFSIKWTEETVEVEELEEEDGFAREKTVIKKITELTEI